MKTNLIIMVLLWIKICKCIKVDPRNQSNPILRYLHETLNFFSVNFYPNSRRFNRINLQLSTVTYCFHWLAHLWVDNIILLLGCVRDPVRGYYYYNILWHTIMIYYNLSYRTWRVPDAADRRNIIQSPNRSSARRLIGTYEIMIYTYYNINIIRAESRRKNVSYIIYIGRYIMRMRNCQEKKKSH